VIRLKRELGIEVQRSTKVEARAEAGILGE
jgi:hypothetical protein